MGIAYARVNSAANHMLFAILVMDNGVVMTHVRLNALLVITVLIRAFVYQEQVHADVHQVIIGNQAAVHATEVKEKECSSQSSL